MVLASTLAAVLVAIGAMIAYDLRLYHTGWLADAGTQAELLAKTTAPALAFDDARVAKENLELLRFRPEVRAAAVYSARGQVIATFASEEAHAFPKLPEADGVRIRGDHLTVFKRVISDQDIVGTVYLSTRYELYDRLLGYLGIAVVVVLLAMGAAFLLSSRLQRAITDPLEAISDVARGVSEQRNFALRARKMSSDEIGLVADSFNTMLAEIERTSREREESSREVLRLNAELEDRVRERTSQLEYTNAELEAFCYSVSHDLRGPLRAIDGFSSALLEDFPDDVPEDAKHYLARIRGSTLRMGQLIEDLLNLSRVSRTELQRRDVDVSDVARQVLADLQQRDPARKVAAHIWDGMRADADARLLKAALENLVGNAWKFTGQRENATIEVGALRDNASTTFFVRDNGAGFDMKYASKLFGAFQRLHAASEFQGSGIGLATVQRIVHRHGGRIWADAKPGQGAVFFFTLAPGSTALQEKAA